MEELSEQAIKANCPNCDTTSQTFSYILEETENFYIVCDVCPLVEGHILIIPKQHTSCIGEYPEYLFKEFLKLNEKVSVFLKKEYGSISSFEHGVFGQTIFHSHIHYLPFIGNVIDIISENKFTIIESMLKLKKLLRKDGGYLFFSLGDIFFVIDKNISTPGFFRDRLAVALNVPERGNWREMYINRDLMKKTEKENKNTQAKWKSFFDK